MSKCHNGLVPVDQRLLELLDNLPAGEDPLVISARLRSAGHEPQLIAQALTQARLRQRARAKFGEAAGGLLLTDEALQQASRMAAARHHAETFANLGSRELREVGCGIGADTLAFAEAGLTVHARELDRERAEYAAYNLRHYPNVTVELADGLADVTEPGLWADPARRGPTGRIAHPEGWAPALSAVVAAGASCRLAGIKIAPGIDHRYLGSSHTEWISAEGDLLEAVMWRGEITPGRSAVLLGVGRLDLPGDPSRPPEQVAPGPLRRYLFEPDPAVIRAGGIAHLCREFDLAPIAASLAYLSGDTEVSSPFLTGFEIRDVVKIKRLPAALRAADIGRVEIKKRGMDTTPEQLRSRLGKLTGSKSATVFLAPTVEGRRAIIARRL
ncbi:MAG: SAM-dependent methyltransferase [Flaviflexus sp.]|nr:SAM-dependent methyltransferase [Flaviflexus sp.]